MTKKGGNIIILVILALIALGFGGYKIAGDISQKKANEEIIKKSIITSNYMTQNEAFYDLPDVKYRPYDKRYEWRLQAHINLYIRETGKIITLKDVETFLATPENPDGTQRTWVDDETGIVIDFVDWYGWNSDELSKYIGDLWEILARYCVKVYQQQGRICPYSTLSDLTPEQIIELDKKYVDPDYELEW